MKQHRELTEAEAEELERLCIEGRTRKLTREETVRARLLQGFDQEEAEWLAAAGGLPQ